MTRRATGGISRRGVLQATALAVLGRSADAAVQGLRSRAEFQLACMTYVYRAFPLARALEGIASAGFRYVAWGTEHVEADGRRTPVLAPSASAAAAARLGRRCRDAGLQPVMLFSTVYPEQPTGPEVLKRRIEQAQAGGVSQVLTFGHTEGDGRRLWLERLPVLGDFAKSAGVLLVIKQHGGESGSGLACARITRELNHPAVAVCYDAGNVMDYLNADPIPDLAACRDQVRSFCLKDHRNFPRDEDCGPGWGEIDHFRLLSQMQGIGNAIPLCFENISRPVTPSRDTPAQVDADARWARDYVDGVLAGLTAAPPPTE